MTIHEHQPSPAPAARPSRVAAAGLDQPDGHPSIDLATAPDFYIENGLHVFTAAHHLRRGWCCGRGCRHCPYDPPHQEGNTQVR